MCVVYIFCAAYVEGNSAPSPILMKLHAVQVNVRVAHEPDQDHTDFDKCFALLAKEAETNKVRVTGCIRLHCVQ